MRELPHRDDLPFDAAEEIVRALKEIHPEADYVQFMGDLPEDAITPEVRAAADAVSARFQESLTNGTCISCGKQMPGWPPTEPEDAPWELPDGWYTLESMRGDVEAFECRECDPEGAAEIDDDLEGRE